MGGGGDCRRCSIVAVFAAGCFAAASSDVFSFRPSFRGLSFDYRTVPVSPRCAYDLPLFVCFVCSLYSGYPFVPLCRSVLLSPISRRVIGLSVPSVW